MYNISAQLIIGLAKLEKKVLQSTNVDLVFFGFRREYTGNVVGAIKVPSDIHLVHGRALHDPDIYGGRKGDNFC